MADIQIQLEEITVGKELPWAVYDSKNTLLLKKGYIISSQRQLDLLLSKGLYRAKGEGADAEPAKPLSKINPFDAMSQFISRLQQANKHFLTGNQEANPVASIQRLAGDLQKVCDDDPDAMLGIVHLWDVKEYACFHNIAVAILCELVSDRLGISTEGRLTLLCAALTANLGMHELHDDLHQHKGPLRAEQKLSIQNHPEESVALLQKVGVNDQKWLTAVLQHHERMDGKGYPQQLSFEKICNEAKLIGLADMYSAKVSHRGDRGAIPSKEVLKELFAKKDRQYDEQLALVFIKEMTIFPPGSFVRLANGDIALVIKRKPDSMWPWVASLVTPRGGPYATPMRRDSAQEQFQIKEMVKQVEKLPLNLQALWGYTHHT